MSTRPRAVPGRAAAALLVLVAMLGLQAAAGAAPRAHRPIVSTCGNSSCDWAEFHQTPLLTGYAANSTVSTANASQLGVAWATNIYGAALDSPVVAYNATLKETLAYIGTENGDVEAINVATGQIVWGTWIGSPIRTTPQVSGGAVWVGTFDSPKVYKLDATTGVVDCSVVSPQPIEGTPVAADPPGGIPTIYIGTNDSQTASGPIMAINAATCALEWSFTDYLQETGNWTAAAYAVDATGEPLVVFGTADPDATLYAIDAVTGARVWTYSIYNPPPGTYDIGAGALITPPGVNGFADGMVYVPSKFGILYALDLTTGTVVWQTNFNQIAGFTAEDGRSTPALDGVNLVFGSGTGLFDLNALTGAVIWQYVNPTNTESLSSPAISGPAGQEVVSVGEIGGGVDFVSLATGAQLYRYQTGGYITASPAVTDGNVLMASSDGFLYDFAAGGGNEKALPTTTITSPADASTVPNPNGNLTIAGAAADGLGVAGVSVAIQENGPDGDWWDGATQTWSSGSVDNIATLAALGATSSTWTYSFPVPPSGAAYTVAANTLSTGGQSDIKGGHVGFAVQASTKGAHIKVNPPYIAPGSSITLTGSGFTPNESVALSLVGTVLATATANSKGNITSMKVKIPSSSPFGLTSLQATGAKSGFVAAAPLTIANAWEQQGYGPAHTGFEPNDPVLYNLVHPGTNLFVDLAWHYQTGSVVDTSPAVVDGLAYVGDTAGQLFAIDIRNGTPMWTWKDAAGKAIGGSPAVDPLAHLAMVGVGDGTLDAISTTTGKLSWSATIGGNVSAPMFLGGEVYVTSSNGVLEALAESTGKKTWSITLASPSSAAPALDVATKELFVGEANGHVQEVNATTGALGWVFDAAGAVTASPAVYSGQVYVGSAGDSVYSLAETTGTQTWVYKTAGAVHDTPSLTNQITPSGIPELIVGDAAGKMYFISTSNASLNYVISFSPGVTGVCTVRGVAVGEVSNGLLTAARSYSDLDTWRYKTTGTLSTAPVVVDGTIYIGAGDGNLYAFTSYGQPPD